MPGTSSARIKPAIIAGTLAAAIVAVILALVLSGGKQADRATPQPAAHETMRTVVVFPASGKPAPSEPGSILHARRVAGRIPAEPVTATVLTDEDCAADRNGISNCLNKLKLDDDSVLAVRHPHNMQEVPCLGPGERVRVRAA